jgi:TolA-binding protein
MLWLPRTLRPLLLAAACAAALTLAGCQDKAAQLWEIAQFEELQNNPEHARQLYEQILRDHPNSEQAASARERLAELSKPSD